MGIVKPCYKVIVPKGEGDFKTQWEDCFNELYGILQKGYQPFKICVFIHAADEIDCNFKSELIRNCLYSLENGRSLPFSVIPQSPEEPYDVTIELGMVVEKKGFVRYHSVDGINYCIITPENQLQECWMVGAMSAGKHISRVGFADESFQKLKLVLDNSELNFDTIVRQWNYVGEILDSSSVEGTMMQHYQIFNEVRNSYYSQYRKRSNFPAATGIGMNSTLVGIDCYAIENHSNIRIIPISNPNQAESYHYDQDVLIGDPIIHKQSPQFERAILLKAGTTSRLIISGTASIVGQKTIGIGDVELQTRITINNIETLVSRTNIEPHCSNLAEYPDKYSYLRVYVKNRSDISAVKKICTEYFGDVPTTFVQADICRDNLLVEIEAEKMNVLNTLI